MIKPKVILRKCDHYKADTISTLLRESMVDLDCQIKGEVFIKPNVVTANKKYIHYSFTHPSVVEAMVQVLKEDHSNQIVVGESGGYGTPTRMFLKEAGYYDMAKQLGVKLIDLNEHALVRVPLTKGVWHKEMMLSKYIHNAGFKIWMPKLKYHAFASITNTLKLNMGILVHKERMLYHDYRIHAKIVDLLEAGYPDLVVSDAIDITYGVEAAPYPVRLGAIIISNHPLASDVVSAYIMGFKPEEVQHLRMASERGYGSLKLEDISVSGDVGIEELRERPKGDSRLFQVLSELDTSIEFHSGFAPNTDSICDGGCECSVKGCLGIIERHTPNSLITAKRGAIVMGVYNGDVVTDGPVLLVGDCTKVDGKLDAKHVFRAAGCPVSISNLFGKVSRLFGIPNPARDMRDRLLFIINSLEKGCHTIKNRFFEEK